ncbi:MAG TPA: discoidin domain-containing protein [Candidatus Acidoferrales bacterium]|nr:discoidin domain-containing protein [Candidatus Acidoferrales bacterium]
MRAVGVGIDSDNAGKVPFLYSKARTDQMLAAGLGVVSYRLYTELSIQDWHWNPTGSFSDAAHGQGYWTSSSSLSTPEIVDSFGYTLPHRGSTEDQGDDNGYSRIDDGDPNTYWKSDPYLAQPYTGDPDSEHPQWIVIDLIYPKPVDAIGIDWMDPYARRYEVQYWTGSGDAIFSSSTPERVPGATAGVWQDFPAGAITNGSGGNVRLRLAATPISVRFVRVWMTGSSNTCDTHGSADRRNCLGYAINEVYLGQMDSAGNLHDIIRHSTCGGVPDGDRRCKNHQTVIFASSNDPWHTSQDRILSGQDQPGLDFVSRNAITRGLPMMYPVPLFYSTPANAAAEVRYLKARGYPLQYIEMGEEIDGQYALPEDYAALYVEFANAIHAVDPSAKLGGPVFQGVNSDIKVWPDASGDDSWFRRFLNYLRSHHHLSDLAFMSFEHYPFRGCDQGVTLRMDLLREPALVRQVISAWRDDGLPSDVPMFITESNFANNGGPVPKQMAGALWMADWIGTALSDGVSGINYYQYEAEPLGHSRQCDKWGGYDMFIVDQNFRILAKASQYYAAQMIAQQWLEPGDLPQRLFNVTTTPSAANPSVTAYAAKRPDGLWSIMIVNKDAEAHEIHLQFSPAALFATTAALVTFGEAQYNWSGDSATELPDPNSRPLSAKIDATKDFAVAPMSITVVRI